MQLRLPPSMVLALTQLLVEGSAFLRNLILARLIGVDEMGLAIAIALGIRIFEMVGDFGLERWLVQVRTNDLQPVRGTVHLIHAVKGISLMGLAMLLAAPLANAFQPQIDPAIFCLAAIAIAVRGFVNCDYRERQRERKYLAGLKVEGGSNIIALAATAPIALLTGDYSAIAWASITQAIALNLLSHATARRPISFGADTVTIGRALRFGFPVACNAILMFLALQGDRFIVAIYFEPGVLAAFAIAAQLTVLPALVGARFLLALDLPRFSRISERSGEWQFAYRLRLIQVTGVAAGLVISLGLFGESVVRLLYGQDFVTGSSVMELLALAAGLRLARAVPNTMLMALGKTPILLAGNLPRILAVFAAYVALANGAGLPMVALIGAASEAAGLFIGLAAVWGFDRRQSTFAHSPVGT